MRWEKSWVPTLWCSSMVPESWVKSPATILMVKVQPVCGWGYPGKGGGRPGPAPLTAHQWVP